MYIITKKNYVFCYDISYLFLHFSIAGDKFEFKMQNKTYIPYIM